MYRAYWHFYKSIFPFIVAFSILSILYLGILWGFVLFITGGLIIGFIGFRTFYNEQFYFYFNLGITKWQLLKVSFLINLLIGVPSFAMMLLILSFFLGSFTIT
ncbi:hypothetical protein MB09_03240 [Aequorivita vladivostokensis]|uniref:Uncharacterized protein n=1 Tax=Aequorivita vladivostokensis TaxID=171194 RepID=A0ABR5DKG1_9FLAO|nr:hypothetical protein MB09_03240 [Aequorivita vladivostokensis]